MKSRKTIAIVIAVISVLSMMVGSLAYFTDRVQATATATAGSLELQLSAINTSKATNFKPGEGVTIDFTLSNIGNKSADVLETLVLESSVPMSATTEFELYAASDVTLDANGVVTSIESGAQPLQVRSINTERTQITYKIPEFILDGSGENAETETGSKGASKESSYVLVFRVHAGNNFQKANVTIYYEAQAKQHHNTNSNAWRVLQNQTITFAGNSTQSVADKTE